MPDEAEVTIIHSPDHTGIIRRTVVEEREKRIAVIGNPSAGLAAWQEILAHKPATVSYEAYVGSVLEENPLLEESLKDLLFEMNSNQQSIHNHISMIQNTLAPLNYIKPTETRRDRRQRKQKAPRFKPYR